mmetsp:Transcript_19443/g.41946  ORF Transcript_19443/g.41946 Transcript_19443/m.41946 type:complete len:94 (+) Transcript_19443:75-356(+)
MRPAADDGATPADFAEMASSVHTPAMAVPRPLKKRCWNGSDLEGPSQLSRQSNSACKLRRLLSASGHLLHRHPPTEETAPCGRDSCPMVCTPA